VSGAASGTASASASATPAGPWIGELSGALEGTVVNKAVPQCEIADDAVSVILSGTIDGRAVVTTVLSEGSGSFNLAHPADEAPRVDIATAGEPPQEWLGVAGQDGEGALIIREDGGGTMDVTLPLITAGERADLRLVASWRCD
jgi:hypothetical protein